MKVGKGYEMCCNDYLKDGRMKKSACYVKQRPGRSGMGAVTTRADADSDGKPMNPPEKVTVDNKERDKLKALNTKLPKPERAKDYVPKKNQPKSSSTKEQDAYSHEVNLRVFCHHLDGLRSCCDCWGYSSLCIGNVTKCTAGSGDQLHQQNQGPEA